MEALLAAAASPLPPPVEDLVPDPTLTDLVPADLERLLRLVPTADLYLQDEVEVALHPTLTRVWCPKGRRGQRLVEAPGSKRSSRGKSSGTSSASVGSGTRSAAGGGSGDAAAASRASTLRRFPPTPGPPRPCA